MSRRLPPDPDLEDLFDEDPSLEPYANLLRSSRLKDPPLDPAFRSSLRRQLMDEAWQRSERRPSFFAGLFRGPGLAWAGASMAAVLLAIFVVQLTNQGAPTTQVAYLSSYPSGSVKADQPITLTFNQPMDHQSVEQAIRIEPATQVKFNWQGNQLTIVPAATTLAANTQYHVTIAPTATTATGKAIEKPIAVTFNTEPPPSPAPIPNASPSPGIGIAGERLVRPGVTTVVGWTADGATLFYIGGGGDLGSISADGRSQATLIRDGVRFAALSASGSQLAYARGSSVAVIGADGSGLQVLASGDALGVGWSGSKVVYAVAGDPTAPSASPTASSPGPSPTPSPAASPSPTPSPAASPSPGGSPAPSPSPVSAVPATQAFSVPVGSQDLVFAPDGKHLLYTYRSNTFLSDGLGSAPAWAQGAGSTAAWSPDSTTVAFSADGAIVTAAPDGGRRRSLAALATLGVGPQDPLVVDWASNNLLLVGTAKVLATIRTDGSGGAVVRSLGYSRPLAAPGGTRLGFLRGGDLWVAELNSAGGASTALADAGKVVDSFMQARLAGDATRSGSFLDDAGRQAYGGDQALVILQDPRLRRYYVVSAQVLPGPDGPVLYAVRLVLARGQAEVTSYDETLTLQRGNSGQFLVHAAVAGPRTALGHGPSVVSAAVKGRQVIVTFDSDLAPESVAAAAKVVDPAGKPVVVKSEYSNRVLTISLPELPSVKGYRLTVATTLQDIDHQALAAEFHFDFVPVAAAPSPSPG